jgi:hypothetical protein
MKKLLIALSLVITLGTVSASADAGKGQKLYSKKLKKECGISGAKMASKYSQDEWEEKKDTLKNEIKTICPNVKEKSLKGKYLPHYYDFFYEYANDSGNVPSC